MHTADLLAGFRTAAEFSLLKKDSKIRGRVELPEQISITAMEKVQISVFKYQLYRNYMYAI